MSDPHPKASRMIPLLGVGLALLTILAFGSTLGNGFTNFDDNLYVVNNTHVNHGFTWEGVQWAFTAFYSSNWHPLTWLSHMLDCQLYGLNPAGHHATNILIHVLTVVGLFLWLAHTTGFIWRAAAVTALFAVHPLRVESVAWVAERKDVLSGLFLVLTVAAYTRYALHPKTGSYLVALAAFALGLMCKPMLVSLPFVLLLLDHWPLKRAQTWPKLILEKLPFLALALAGCIITIAAQRAGINSVGVYATPNRLANAVITLWIYIRQLVWPGHLAVLYPFPTDAIPTWEWISAAALITTLSYAAWKLRRIQPWLATGWGWYLVMLGPVIGIIQVGRQAHADRYTYLPHIGLCMAAVWMIAEMRLPVLLIRIATAVAVVALAFGTWHQTQYWKSSQALWEHTLAFTTNNPIAHNNLGNAYFDMHDLEMAKAEFHQSITEKPGYAEAHSNLGYMYFCQSNYDAALSEYQLAVHYWPGFSEAHQKLGTVWRAKGNVGAAMDEYRTALKYDPAMAIAHNDLGTALRQTGHIDEAIEHYQIALNTLTTNESIFVNLGNAFNQRTRFAEAIIAYRRALALDPNDSEVENNLAWLLATAAPTGVRDPMEAVEWAKKANLAMHGTNAVVLNTLAVSLAEANQLPEAATTLQSAIRCAEVSGQTNLAAQFRQELPRFQKMAPVHP